MKVHRRTFLRGAGEAMALPLFDAPHPGRGLAATPGGVPRRMVCINTPQGMHPEFFFPEDSGRGYRMSPDLDVLRDLRDDFSVISGLSDPDVGPSHDSNLSFLTAAPQPERRASFKNSVSLDQFAADHIHGQTRFPTLTLSCEGSGLSWTRSGAPVPTEDWPSSVFARLFLEGRPDEVKAPARRLADGQSVLDAVRDQARRMERGLGAGDREKLDEYFTSVRELEQRLTQASAWSKKPKPKVNSRPPLNIQKGADSIGKTRLWFDQSHLALQPDSTRLITLQLLGTSDVPPIPRRESGPSRPLAPRPGPRQDRPAQDPGAGEDEDPPRLPGPATRDEGRRREPARPDDGVLRQQPGRRRQAQRQEHADHPGPGGFRHGQHLAFDEDDHPPLGNLYVSMLQRMGIEADRFGGGSSTLSGFETRA